MFPVSSPSHRRSGLSGRVEGAGELGIGVITQLVGDDRPKAGEEQQLPVLRQVADLIRRKQRPAGVLVREGQARLFAIESVAHGLEHDGFLAEQIGHQAGAVVIVDAEHLQDAGIAQEGAGALAVGGAELVNVLQDRPELDAIAGHEAHCALDGGEVAEGGELIQQVEDRHGRLGGVARHVGQALRDEATRPYGIFYELGPDNYVMVNGSIVASYIDVTLTYRNERERALFGFFNGGYGSAVNWIVADNTPLARERVREIWSGVGLDSAAEARRGMFVDALRERLDPHHPVWASLPETCRDEVRASLRRDAEAVGVQVETLAG